MKSLSFLLLACLPAFLFAQLPKADPNPQRAIPKRGELMLQLDMPSINRWTAGAGPVRNAFTYKGTLGVGYMIGTHWQIGGNVLLGFSTDTYGESRNNVPIAGGSLYGRYYLDFQKWYAFGELGIGGDQSRRLSSLGRPLVTKLFAEVRYGIGMPITPRIRIEASNAFRLTQTRAYSFPSYPKTPASDFFAPRISLNIRLGSKR